MNISLPADYWVILILLLVAINSSIVGTFMVLRGNAMLADAMSHAVLFGLAVAAILSGSVAPPLMLFGGTVACLLTAYFSQYFKQHGQVQEDASIGVTFTWLFAMGVILISVFARQIDIDQECVLAGEIALAPFDIWAISYVGEVPKAFFVLFIVFLVNLLALLFGYRYFKLLSFDAVQVMILGLNPKIINFILLLLVSLTTVASFESVGVILILSLIVTPPATAYLFTRSLKSMLIIALIFAVLSVFSGYYIAVHFDGSISAAVAMAAGFFFFLSWLMNCILKLFVQSNKKIITYQ